MTTTQLDDGDNGLATAAAKYAEHGWAVFPCRPRGKEPIVTGGFRAATTDESQVRRWWAQTPTANIGFCPGSARLLVIDVDGETGEKEAQALGLFSEPTLRVETARGCHLYFLAPAEPVEEGAGKLGVKLDVRGERGYVILPPSVHETGAVYRFADSQTPALAVPPRALERLRHNGTKPAAARAAAVVGQVIPCGERNATLTSLAGSMRRRAMTAEEIEAALLAVNVNRCQPRLDENEVRRIATSVAGYAPAEGREARRCDATDDGLTDSGNAGRLLALHGPRLHYVPAWRLWLVEHDGYWTIDHHDVCVRQLAKDVGRQLKQDAARMADADRAKRLFNFALRTLNAPGISGLVNLARGIHGIPLEHEQLDANGWVLGVENGVIDLRTGRLRPTNPADLMTMRCPVRWDENAGAPRWERALQEWFPDSTVRAYVQRVAGAALVGSQRDHVFTIHFGLGGNGKGTFTRALQRALGPYAIEVHLSLLIETRYHEHDTVKADLFRTRLAVAVETERRVRLAEASVKNLTGGDRIRARRMREDPWSFDPTHSLWLQTNHLPEITGRDHGIWRRVRVVKWQVRFEGAAEDKNLDDVLASEAPGILRWLVGGCLEWQKHGLAEPEAVVRATLEYREREDVLARFAADTGLVFRSGLEIPASALHELLMRWADEEGITAPRQDVGDWLKDNGARRGTQRWTDEGKSRRRIVWYRVGIADDVRNPGGGLL